jgi:hypothetical protein
MEYISVLEKSDFNIDEKVRTNFKNNNISHNKTNTGPANDKFFADSDENFSGYLQCHGLANEPKLLVLSSSHHYYYDLEDFRGVRILINQKKLNQIKQLNDFLFTVYNVLSPKTSFIGCFSDRNTQKGISLSSRMYKKFINFLDSRTEIEIDKKDISRLLESHGFKVIDMTEINGLTYFLTQN